MHKHIGNPNEKTNLFVYTVTKQLYFTYTTNDWNYGSKALSLGKSTYLPNDAIKMKFMHNPQNLSYNLICFCRCTTSAAAAVH
jgi:hypothetical protein